MADVVERLLPCPFCGSEAKHQERHNPMSRWRHSIDCCSSSCGMSGPVAASKREAIELWNARARLSQAGAGGGVVVRPLEWRGIHTVRDWAPCAFGRYEVASDGYWTGPDNIDGKAASLDEAKAAAQSDYEARILAALAPSPSAEEPVNLEATDAGRAAYVARYGTTPDTEPLWDDLPSDVKAIWRRVGMAARSTPPATPVQPTASVEAVDPRPANCRFRLCDEGKPYPKSSCSACGKGIASGLGKRCTVGLAITDEAPSASLTPAPTQGDGGARD